MTAPSRHHTGVDAFWLDPQGNECGVPELNRDNFPVLPQAWFDGLQKPEPQAESDVDDWQWAPESCWLKKVWVERWPTDEPNPDSNWHNWFYDKAIRLTCGHRFGCFTEADYKETESVLVECYEKGSTDAGDKPTEHDITHPLSDAINKAASFTDEEVAEQLGTKSKSHIHQSQGAKRRVEPDADFWDARPLLAQIRALSRARLTAPYPVMGETLLRVAASTPPTVVLPPLRGGVASLNLFVALVGESGWGGKDTARDVAALIVSDRSNGSDAHFSGDPLMPDIHPYVAPQLLFLTKMPGSGEGVPRLFGYNKRQRDSNGNDIWTMERTEPNAVLMIASELDGLLAVGKRPGSTILPILRISYNGGTLGFTNADQQRTIQIDAHTYRLALSVGVQPLRAAPLLTRLRLGPSSSVAELVG